MRTWKTSNGSSTAKESRGGRVQSFARAGADARHGGTSDGRRQRIAAA